MRITILVYLFLITGCSTANQWRPIAPLPPSREPMHCKQVGASFWDCDGELLTNRQIIRGRK